jgi:hypothetical protein
MENPTKIDRYSMFHHYLINKNGDSKQTPTKWDRANYFFYPHPVGGQQKDLESNENAPL